MVKRTFTISDLDKVTKFVHAVQQASNQYGVTLDSYDAQFLAVDGKDTPLHVALSDEGTYDVSVVVPA